MVWPAEALLPFPGPDERRRIEAEERIAAEADHHGPVPGHRKGLRGGSIARQRLHEFHGTTAGSPAVTVSQGQLPVEKIAADQLTVAAVASQPLAASQRYAPIGASRFTSNTLVEMYLVEVFISQRDPEDALPDQRPGRVFDHRRAIPALEDRVTARAGSRETRPLRHSQRD
jgi:hypothetical protein